MRRLATLAALAAAWLGAGRAAAYCRATTGSPQAVADAGVPACPNVGTAQEPNYEGILCDPPLSNDNSLPDGSLLQECGIPIQWAQHCVSFDVQQDGSNQVDLQTATLTLEQAFATWLAADCGDGTPSIRVSDFGPVACNVIQYNHDGVNGNANVLIFRDDVWPYQAGAGDGDILALTTVTYDVDTADMYDADIEVNTADYCFTTNDMSCGEGGGGGGGGCGGDRLGPYDLLGVLTHEVGHFLGLAHTNVQDATMFPDANPCNISMRALSADDVEAICDTYPPGRDVDPNVVPCPDCCIPLHGWASQCTGSQDVVSCGVGRDVDRGPRPASRGSTAPEGSFASALTLLAAIGVRRLRGRSGRRGS